MVIRIRAASWSAHGHRRGCKPCIALPLENQGKSVGKNSSTTVAFGRSVAQHTKKGLVSAQPNTNSAWLRAPERSKRAREGERRGEREGGRGRKREREDKAEKRRQGVER
ncbi:hypothetical protein KM043_017852 [Ampulex compressa]|nr:hypothetical protein KM043_017852 [Ampulex compressa]